MKLDFPKLVATATYHVIVSEVRGDSSRPPWVLESYTHIIITYIYIHMYMCIYIYMCIFIFINKKTQQLFLRPALGGAQMGSTLVIVVVIVMVEVVVVVVVVEVVVIVVVIVIVVVMGPLQK